MVRRGSFGGLLFKRRPLLALDMSVQQVGKVFRERLRWFAAALQLLAISRPNALIDFNLFSRKDDRAQHLPPSPALQGSQRYSPTARPHQSKDKMVIVLVVPTCNHIE